MDVVALWINCPNAETADRIAERMVAARLAACANRYPEIVSRYRWKGAVETAREVPLLLKTRRALVGRLMEEARGLHPYETPAMWCVEMAEVEPGYADWLREETGG